MKTYKSRDKGGKRGFSWSRTLERRKIPETQVKKGTEGKTLPSAVTQLTAKMQHLKAKGDATSQAQHTARTLLTRVLGRKSKKKELNRAHSRVLFFGYQLRKKDKGVKLLPSQVCCKWEAKSPRWAWISQILPID